MTDEVFNSADDIFLEKLGSDARRRNVPRELCEVRTAEDLARARELVNSAIDRGITTAQALSKRTGIKPSAISAFRNDKWGKGSAGTLLTTASQLSTAIDHLIDQQRSDETSIEGFVTTRFAAAVISLVSYVRRRRIMGAFVAPAGSGKSMVLAHIENETPGAMRITVRKPQSAPRSFMQSWLRAMGQASYQRTDALQERLIQSLAGTSRLVLIDEAHKLQVATLDVIRECFDACRVPIVLSGTPRLLLTMTGQRVGSDAVELMDQLFSRVGMVRDLTHIVNDTTGEPERLFTLEDIRRVFSRNSVRLLRDAEDFLCKLANSPAAGGLRLCSGLVQMVVDAYPGETVSAAKLNQALRYKIGPRAAEACMETASIVQVQEAARVAG